MDRYQKFSAFVAATLVGCMAGSTITLADGMPAPRANQEYRPCANWSGGYVGPHVGAGWARTDWKWTNDNFFSDAGDRSSIDPFGYIAGLHGGVQHQWGCWVAGIEGTFSGGDISKKIASPFFPDEDHHTATISSLATVTGRLGYSSGNLLFYGKAGFATGMVELTAVTDRDSVGAQSREWQNGWVVGAGLDYQIGRNISVGLEYNYVNLGESTRHFSCSAPDCGGADAPIVKTDADIHVVMARFTFLFGRAEPAGPFK